MLWPRKRAEAVAPAASDDIAPATLPVALDDALFKRHFAQLLRTAEPDGGIEEYVARLGGKQRGFAGAFADSRVTPLTLPEVAALLERMFTVRRRIFPAFETLGEAHVGRLVLELVRGPGSVAQRMQRFVDAMPGTSGTDRESTRAAAKLRRAAWDFAAEAIHFSDPVRFPLMTRWVWDRATQSGALREFIRGGNTMAEIAFSNEPGVFEAARQWLAQRIAGEGIYRDVPLWIDLVLAQAYTTYLHAMAGGSLGAEFGRGAPPHEQLRKLLGIDAAARKTGSRVKGLQHADT
jgi:hypothetical protein